MAGDKNTLIVMLPGALMPPGAYRQSDFAQQLAAHWPDAEFMPIDIDVNQLDVTAPVAGLHAQLQAVLDTQRPRQLILGGISLGATVALHYTRRFPAGVDGLCLLAPYPGSRITTHAIRAAGGPSVWRLGDEQCHDDEFLLWNWLLREPPVIPVHLAYGKQDRFADGLAMMVAALPQARVHIAEGGHDWPTWQALWADFVTRHADFAAPAMQGAD